MLYMMWSYHPKYLPLQSKRGFLLVHFILVHRAHAHDLAHHLGVEVGALGFVVDISDI